MTIRSDAGVEPLWDRQQAASFLKIRSVSTLYKWIKLGRLRSYKSGGKAHFKQSDLQAFLNQKFIKAKTEADFGMKQLLTKAAKNR
jgi:excisionase family DNA binding protein